MYLSFASINSLWIFYIVLHSPKYIPRYIHSIVYRMINSGWVKAYE